MKFGKGKDFPANGPISAHRPRHGGAIASLLGQAQRKIQARMARSRDAHPRLGHRALGGCDSVAAVEKPGDKVWRHR
jgi:hypothetical protein